MKPEKSEKEAVSKAIQDSEADVVRVNSHSKSSVEPILSSENFSGIKEKMIKKLGNGNVYVKVEPYDTLIDYHIWDFIESHIKEETAKEYEKKFEKERGKPILNLVMEKEALEMQVKHLELRLKEQPKEIKEKLERFKNPINPKEKAVYIHIKNWEQFWKEVEKK